MTAPLATIRVASARSVRSSRARPWSRPKAFRRATTSTAGPALITKPGHKLEGTNIRDKILFFPTAKGGIAAGWAFYDIKHKGIAPKAFVFGVTNPVMVQGAVFAGITITEGWDPPAAEAVRTGDWVRVDPERKVIEVLRRAQ